MTTRLTAQVLNVFLASALEILREVVGTEACLEKLEAAEEIPGAPTLTMSIAIRGGLIGAVHWNFDERLAHSVAKNMLPPEVLADATLSERADAVGELANMIAGNATGALLEAGYKVELFPPQNQPAQRLGQRMPNLILATAQGRVRIILEVEPCDEAG